MAENLPLTLSCLALGTAVGIAAMHWLTRSKSVDARAEAIKALALGAAALSRISSNDDDIIAAANARKAAEAVALDALKAKIAQL